MNSHSQVSRALTRYGFPHVIAHDISQYCGLFIPPAPFATEFTDCLLDLGTPPDVASLMAGYINPYRPGARRIMYEQKEFCGGETDPSLLLARAVSASDVHAIREIKRSSGFRHPSRHDEAHDAELGVPHTDVPPWVQYIATINVPGNVEMWYPVRPCLKCGIAPGLYWDERPPGSWRYDRPLECMCKDVIRGVMQQAITDEISNGASIYRTRDESSDVYLSRRNEGVAAELCTALPWQGGIVIGPAHSLYPGSGEWCPFSSYPVSADKFRKGCFWRKDPGPLEWLGLHCSPEGGYEWFDPDDRSDSDDRSDPDWSDSDE